VGGALCIFAVAVLLSLLKLPASRRYVFIALLLPISIHTQVELPFYISALHWFLFLTLLAMVLSPTQIKINLSLSSAARSSLKITSIVVLMLSSVFFIHSYQSSVEIKQFISKTDKNKAPLDTALQNPYFKNVATDLLMFSMFNQSINKGISSNIALFKEWAESTIALNPHPNHFLVAINSNRYLNNKAKACELAKKANEIYPDNKSFISVLESCNP
jgi:O-antigen polymerase